MAHHKSTEGVNPAFPGAWDQYNFSPVSRTQYPVRIHRTTGIVSNEANLLEFKSTTIVALPQSNGIKYSDLYSSITIDFGKEVCGPVTITSGPSSTPQTAAFSYSEGSEWVGFDSDDASSLRPSIVDGHFEFQIGPKETYTVPLESQRGGYRYLTIFTKTPDAILEIEEVSAHFTSMPHWQNLRAYPSYFFCSDELLNRLWYASAYTNQLSTLAKDQARRCELDSGWLNNAVCCTSGETVITDAPRRDRTVWAGDFAIVVWSQFATIGDSISMRNALDTLFDVQSEEGQFPWAGPPICHDSVSDLAKSKEWPYMSDSYHLWTILVARHFYHLTGDLGWLKEKWERIVLGMQLASRFRPDEGLYYCVGDLDWGRSSVKGFNLSCNILFHETLLKLAPIATLLGSPKLATQWLEIASTLKQNLKRFWDPSAGLYIDNLNAPNLHPQDGNSLACWFDITDLERAQTITTNLKRRWGPFGPINPECSGPVSPFISGFELQALVHANKINDALSMIRKTWGWMINNPASTGSTMLEAWGANGQITYPFYKDKPSYISHCHPFSTGPVLVLTFELLGLNFTDAGGKSWEFRPSLGDLEHCQGGFTGTYGKYSAGWKRIRENGKIVFTCWVEASAGTIGRFRLPALGSESQKPTDVEKDVNCETKYGYRWLDGISGGERHSFVT
ncbi:glycoside hydrolase family 78 protein [Hyaloscypha variabilis F]|uniref:Glycoside hydrolase family 78 protein n=1 Tax=Hyaloscypha variabilis (strain UAMH 11265 / GT02V1 / F) TaxID=1149755 RepID=A0A2J6SE35_HYAVF|nr:glycoside hydrolase family 78 protein [Hyaloscypha variabilis F]